MPPAGSAQSGGVAFGIDCAADEEAADDFPVDAAPAGPADDDSDDSADDADDRGASVADEPGSVDAGKEFSSYATLRAGMSYEEHEIDWFDWIIGVLDAATPH